MLSIDACLVVDLPHAVEEEREGGRVALGLGGHRVVEGALGGARPERVAGLDPLALHQGLEPANRRPPLISMH